MRLGEPGTAMNVISSSLPNWAEALTAVVSAAALVAIILGAVQIRHVNRQMHRELEALYLVRYWELMDRRSRSFALRNRATRSDRPLVRDYLALSEDQLGLRALGRVTDHTWEFWSRDIRRQNELEAYQAELKRAPDSTYPHLRKLLDDPGYDPLDRGPLWRLTQGL